MLQESRGRWIGRGFAEMTRFGMAFGTKRETLAGLSGLGDLVLYEGRSYVLRGLDPMGVPQRRVILEDPETGEEFAAWARDVSPAEPCPPSTV